MGDLLPAADQPWSLARRSLRTVGHDFWRRECGNGVQLGSMPLLIIPLVIVVALGCWVLLLPVLLWQRYRLGRARQRALRWVVGFNFWALLVSSACFFSGMLLTEWWWPGAFGYAAGGYLIGGVLGVLGLRLCHFERTTQGVYYTPNRWIILGLTLLVAVRVALSAVELWRSWKGEETLALVPSVDHASLFGVAGLVLGYYLVFTWGLRRRLVR